MKKKIAWSIQTDFQAKISCGHVLCKKNEILGQKVQILQNVMKFGRKYKAAKMK